MPQASFEAIPIFYADSDDIKIQGMVFQDGTETTLDVYAVWVRDRYDDRTVPRGMSYSVYGRHAAPDGGSCDVSD
jgi:hypothetical protein